MRGPATVWPLLLLALVAGAAADSVLGPFNGVIYTIGTTTGVYKDIEDRLQAQPWWNNKDFAKALAVAVGNRFGRPNLIDQWPGEWGPFAAVSSAADPASVDAFGHWGGGSIYEAYEAQILNVQDSLVWLVAKCPATCPPCTLCTGAASNYQCVKDESLSCQLSELVDDTVSALSEVIADLLGVMQAQAEQGQRPPQEAEKQLQTQLETLQALQEVAAGMLKADTAKPQGSPAPAPQGS